MNTKLSKVFGICFLLSFITYAWGMALMHDAIHVNSTPNQLLNHQTQIKSGFIFIALIHTIADVVLLSVMYRVLKPYQITLSSLYFMFGLIAAFLLALGSLLILLTLPISELYLVADKQQLLYFKTLVTYGLSGNFYAYHTGMIFWGLGGLVLCYLFKISKLVPTGFALFGLVGYLIFITGMALEIFGVKVGLILSVPGGLFEISLSIGLIIKGVKTIQSAR